MNERIETIRRWFTTVGVLVALIVLAVFAVRIGRMEAAITVLQIQRDVDEETSVDYAVEVRQLREWSEKIERLWPWPEHFSPVDAYSREDTNADSR